MASKSVSVTWSGQALRFRGGVPGGPDIRVDSEGREGPSPMDLILIGVAGCMGVDVVMILEKGRVPLSALSVEVEGDRADDPPRRYTALRMRYRISGPGEEHRAKVERAVELSRDTYCSVLHSLREDLPVQIEIQLD